MGEPGDIDVFTQRPLEKEEGKCSHHVRGAGETSGFSTAKSVDSDHSETAGSVIGGGVTIPHLMRSEKVLREKRSWEEGRQESLSIKSIKSKTGKDRNQLGGGSQQPSLSGGKGKAEGGPKRGAKTKLWAILHGFSSPGEEKGGTGPVGGIPAQKKKKHKGKSETCGWSRKRGTVRPGRRNCSTEKPGERINPSMQER